MSLLNFKVVGGSLTLIGSSIILFLLSVNALEKEVIYSTLSSLDHNEKSLSFRSEFIELYQSDVIIQFFSPITLYSCFALGVVLVYFGLIALINKTSSPLSFVFSHSYFSTFASTIKFENYQKAANKKYGAVAAKLQQLTNENNNA